MFIRASRPLFSRSSLPLAAAWASSEQRLPCRGHSASGIFPLSRPRARREAPRSERCPGFPEPGSAVPALPTVVLVSGLSAASPEHTRRPRDPFRWSPPPPPALPFALPRAPSGYPGGPSRSPGSPSRSPSGSSRSPSGPHARVRSYSNPSQTPVRVRSLSRRTDFALGLPRPRRSRARRGDAALLSGRARAPLRPRPAPPRLPTKNRRAPGSAPGPGGAGEGPSRSLCFPPSRSSLYGSPLSPSWLAPAVESAERPTWAGVTGPGAFGQCSREGASPGLVGVPGRREMGGRWGDLSKFYVAGYHNLKQI